MIYTYYHFIMKKVHDQVSKKGITHHVKKISATFFTASAILFFGGAIFLIAVAIYIFIKDMQFKDRIYPQVYVNDVDFGGKSRNDLIQYFEEKNNKLKETSITLRYKEDNIATFSANLLKIQYDIQTIAFHTASIGRSSNMPTKIYQKVITLLNLGRYNFSAHLSYDTELIDEYFDNMGEKYNFPAENALFRFENGKVTAFQPEKQGKQIEQDITREKIDSAIRALEIHLQPYTIVVTDKTIEPEVALSAINDFGIVEEIGYGISDFSGSIPGRIHNLTLASSRLNGVLIPKGETFSFNQMVGDISAQTGYKPAYIIKSGRTVLGDGGGVCQVSTTLFRAALNAGLSVVERVAHAYRVHYYEQDSKPGFDATVFNPSADLKIKNDTDNAILVQTVIDSAHNQLTFTLFGKKDGRTATISDVKLWDRQSPPPPVYQDDPTLKRGVTRQVDWPAGGAKASFHYSVVKNGETIINRDFFSSFRPWRAVYLVGTAD